jgi:hypothetical protein
MDWGSVLLRAAALALFAVSPAAAQSGAGDVVLVPTPQVTAEHMLKMAAVGKNDFVIDLGSGDGRMVILAAHAHGARGFGVDLDPALVATARENAQRAGVAARAEFFRRNMFETDLRQATVVTMYLLPELNLRLRPKLLAELRPGARVLSHDYDMGDWEWDAFAKLNVPEKTVGEKGVSYAYLWIVPASVHGIWNMKLAGADAHELSLVQAFQKIDGVLKLGARPQQLSRLRLRGDEIGFVLESGSGEARVLYDFSGRVRDKTMRGDVRITRGGATVVQQWEATRVSPPKPLDAPPPRQ